MLFEPIFVTSAFDPQISCRGACAESSREYVLPLGYARDLAERLMRSLEREGRIDFDVPADKADPRLATDFLFGEARGQMFGVLACRDRRGRTGMIKAFSGQCNGVWRVPGWAPPLVDVDALKAMSFGVERLVKRITAQMAELPDGSPERERLAERRKALSCALMKDIHNLYRIPNFRRQLTPLPDAVQGGGGIPAGMADCCAPKLLGYAARYGLKPLGLAEFYFGRENRSGTRKHGGIYASCKDKCGRILGYMLCGLDQ